MKQPHALAIERAVKRVEYRTWSTAHRGDLVIVASSNPDRLELEHLGLTAADVDLGVTVVLVEVTAVVALPGVGFEWLLANPRSLERVPVRGGRSLFTIADELVRVRHATS